MSVDIDTDTDADADIDTYTGIEIDIETDIDTDADIDTDVDIETGTDIVPHADTDVLVCLLLGARGSSPPKERYSCNCGRVLCGQSGFRSAALAMPKNSPHEPITDLWWGQQAKEWGPRRY